MDRAGGGGGGGDAPNMRTIPRCYSVQINHPTFKFCIPEFSIDSIIVEKPENCFWGSKYLCSLR